MSETGSSETTEVLYDQSEIVRRVIERCSTVRCSVDACTDTNGPSMVVIPDHPLTKPYADMAKRGVRIRFITEITKDNLPHRKQLMKIAEVRHLDETRGNLGIVDGDTCIP